MDEHTEIKLLDEVGDLGERCNLNLSFMKLLLAELQRNDIITEKLFIDINIKMDAIYFLITSNQIPKLNQILKGEMDEDEIEKYHKKFIKLRRKKWK